jgi:hypothetical protein
MGLRANRAALVVGTHSLSCSTGGCLPIHLRDAADRDKGLGQRRLPTFRRRNDAGTVAHDEPRRRPFFVTRSLSPRRRSGRPIPAIERRPVAMHFGTLRRSLASVHRPTYALRLLYPEARRCLPRGHCCRVVLDRIWHVGHGVVRDPSRPKCLPFFRQVQYSSSASQHRIPVPMPSSKKPAARPPRRRGASIDIERSLRCHIGA